MTAEKARLALELACTNHERIRLALAQNPADSDTKRALVRAVAAGRAAWRWYQASGADRINEVVPEAFKS